MRARVGLLACALLAGCSGKGEFIPTPSPEPQTPTTAAEELIAAPEPATTTTEPPPPSTTVTTAVAEPILCPQLNHPEHHSPCPELRKQTPTPTTTYANTTTAPRSSSSTLAGIRACESGGDYTANTGNGYYGAYQFHPGTWASVGGTGNPAHASPAEQDMRAQMMLDQGRRGEWPNC